MRLGIVSDIHCNAAGLGQALALMGDIDELICLGDSIYEYRFSNDVVRLLKDREAQVIVGNHEECFFGPHGARARARPGIDPMLAEWLASQPQRRELTIGGKRLLLVHSTPWEPRGTYVHPGSGLLARFAEAARNGRFGGLIASGWHTAALMMRLFATNFLSTASSVASPGIDELRWLQPVRPGDALHLRVTVVETRRSRSRPQEGIVRSLIEVLNQDGAVVMSLKPISLIACRPTPPDPE